MTRAAFAALPAYGHVCPLLPLAEVIRRLGADLALDLPGGDVPRDVPGTAWDGHAAAGSSVDPDGR